MNTDIHAALELAEQRGELLRFRRTVDRVYEMPALMQHAEAAGKAYLFEQVKDSPYAVAGGLCNRIERVAHVLDGNAPRRYTHGELAARVRHAGLNGIAPITVTTAPCSEVVTTGADVDLHELPVPTFFERDSGPFITGGIGVSRNPVNGILNAGCYRTLVLGKNTLAVNASLLSDLHGFYREAGSSGQPFPLALAVGVSPALLIAAVSKPPSGVSEFDLAGALQNAPVRLTQAATIDLPVPADAEFVIEGEIDFSHNCDNVLGEFAGLYGLESAPVMRVTAITRRQAPLFYSIMAGNNPEHAILGTIAVYPRQQALIEHISDLSPDIRGVNAFTDRRYGAMLHVAIRLEKHADDLPQQLIRDAFGLQLDGTPVSRFVRRIIVVDEDIDIDDIDDIEWAIWMRCTTADRICIMDDMPSWAFDRSSKPGKGVMRIGIDATLDAANRAAQIRPRIPGSETIQPEDYLGDLGN